MCKVTPNGCTLFMRKHIYVEFRNLLVCKAEQCSAELDRNIILLKEDRSSRAIEILMWSQNITSASINWVGENKIIIVIKQKKNRFGVRNYRVYGRFSRRNDLSKSQHVIYVFFHICNAMNLLIRSFYCTCYLYLMLINTSSKNKASYWETNWFRSEFTFL